MADLAGWTNERSSASVQNDEVGFLDEFFQQSTAIVCRICPEQLAVGVDVAQYDRSAVVRVKQLLVVSDDVIGDVVGWTMVEVDDRQIASESFSER